MKLSLSTLGCPQWTLGQIVEVAAANGYLGLDFRGLGAEIDITRLPEFNDRLPATLQLLREQNLQVACLNTSITLVTPATERWQMMLDECQRNARLAEKLHTRYIRVFGGQLAKDMTHEEGLVLARRHLRQLVKICQQYGCQVVLETHDYWSVSARVMEAVHEFDPSEVGVLWDIEHPYRKRESPESTYAILARFLRHVHFKDSVRVPDPNRPEGRSIPKLIGEGELPVEEFWRVLRDNRYDGWVTLESEKRWHADGPEPEESIPQFARWTRTQST
jgi:sugar phosphate isomerase/epimerase